jgi:membrane protein implicated in regulation of membrane protease activity
MDAVTDLLAAQPFWVWAGLGAALLAIEVMTGTGWLLWASASAGVTAVVVALASTGLPTSLLVFALLTMASTLAARRYLPQTSGTPTPDINDASGRLLGRHGATVVAFANGAGRVAIDGKEWAARLETGESLAAGTNVEVVDIEGAHLKVRPA